MFGESGGVHAGFDRLPEAGAKRARITLVIEVDQDGAVHDGRQVVAKCDSLRCRSIVITFLLLAQYSFGI